MSEQQGKPERPRSFTRFIRRASKVIRPKERTSEDTETPASGETGAAAGSSSAAAPAQRLAAPPKARPSSPEVQIVRTTPTSAASHFRIQEEKARSLFAKYNMQLESGEWIRPRSTGQTEWVEKKIRIRVHRQCHRCQTSFGAAKSCTQCGHARCKKCPRFPDKSLKDPAAAAATAATKLSTVAVDSDPKYAAISKRRAAEPVLTMQGKHGQELVRKLPMHRVRRFCHKCDTLFAGKATVCEKCNHVRCPECPREPPKTKKWPHGYPGDELEKFPLAERTFRHVRQRVRWSCHDCKTTFHEGEKECRSCKHMRCDTCTRQPPKKPRPADPDPAVLASLERKIGRIALSSAA